nr:transposase [Serratia ficaria]
MKYLGRYLKHPPVTASPLRHYRSGAVVHQYYDHRTQQHCRQKLTQEESTGDASASVPAAR